MPKVKPTSPRTIYIQWLPHQDSIPPVSYVGLRAASQGIQPVAPTLEDFLGEKKPKPLSSFHLKFSKPRDLWALSEVKQHYQNLPQMCRRLKVRIKVYIVSSLNRYCLLKEEETWSLLQQWQLTPAIVLVRVRDERWFSSLEAAGAQQATYLQKP